LGTVRDIANTSGSVIDHISYDAFGQILTESSPTNGDRFKFTAREWESTVDLQFNRARYYAPRVGAWLTRDPIGFASRDVNLYRYVFNRVTAGGDPTGLEGSFFGDYGHYFQQDYGGIVSAGWEMMIGAGDFVADIATTGMSQVWVNMVADAYDTMQAAIVLVGVGTEILVNIIGHKLVEFAVNPKFYVDLNIGWFIGGGVQIGRNPTGQWGVFPYAGFQLPNLSISIAPGQTIAGTWNFQGGAGPLGVGWASGYFWELGWSWSPISAGAWWVLDWWSPDCTGSPKPFHGTGHSPVYPGHAGGCQP
jgi:RHS repeat-associated protein